MFIDENLRNSKILVEKPLFNFFKDYQPKNNSIFIGYNLRFHPVISFIKDMVKDKSIWNVKVECSSYLPDWRENIEYSSSSSALIKYGGGVLRDLSHEIDYALWLFGDFNIVYSDSQKISNLNIETDDFLNLYAKNEVLNIHISLNYFSKINRRTIYIDGKDFSLKGDLNKNSIHLIEKEKEQNFSWSNNDDNKTYEKMHKAIIYGDESRVCTFSQGIDTMKIIEFIGRNK